LKYFSYKKHQGMHDLSINHFTSNFQHTFQFILVSMDI
jgi:hypothetical protein